MSNQLQITGGAKVRSLEGVITGTSGVLSSVPLGGANGVATLDSGGKVPVSQLPSSVVTYLGTWNAATNTPTLTNGTGDAGDMYICNVAGTVNFGAGPITFAVGDWVLYGSGTWQKSNGQNGTVTSVAVTESGNALTITGSPITTAGTINIGFAGSSTQYIAGDGTLVTFPTLITEAQTLITDVYNETGATLTKGTVVYINGGHGNLPTVTKAIATGDATSAQTYGVVQADITNNNNGHVVVIGSLGDLDTQAYAAGTQLYLSSTTAGAWTSTKQYAPAHLVYVGIVVRSHPTQGVVEIKIQNGFELDELHNVSAQSPSNGDILQYNSTTSLWTAVAGTTTNIAEGTNLYYTDARSRAAFSETVTGLDYNSTTGVLSTSAGYGIPTTANQTNWTTAYNDSIVSAAVTGTTTKTLTLTQQDGGTVTASWSDYDTAPVTSVFGRTGAVTAQSGDYTTTLVTEGTNLYFTNARSIASTLTGYVSGAGTITSADSILSAIQKLNGNIGTLVTGVSSVFGRTGAVVAASGDYTTTQVTEGTNLYYTDARARGALSFTAGSGAYNSTTGVITIPTNTNQLTNGASFITLTSLSAGTGISYNNTTGVISSTITQYTDAMARAAISLTTTGTSGAATYNSTTGVLNIPNYSETTFGTVTSVGLSSATSGVTIGSSPITTSGTITLAIATASGTQQGLLSSTDWTTFNNKQNALTNPVTGTGTTNYLPKFTATSTIGNSLIYDDGTNVGIGLTNPSYKLDVSGTGRFSGQLNVIAAAANSTVAIFDGAVGGGTRGLKISTGLDYANDQVVIFNAQYSGAQSGYFKFQNAGTTALTIASTGAATFSSNVAQLLTIASTATNGSYLGFTNSGTLNGAIGTGANLIGAITNTDLGIWSTGAIAFQANGSVRLTIASTGDATFTGDVNLFKSGSNRILYVSKSDGTSTIQLNSNGNSYFNGGNVGIGTSSPATLLDVRGEVSIAYNATYGLRFYNDARDNWSSIGNNITGSAAANLVFKTGGGTALTLDNSRAATFSSSSAGLGSYQLTVTDGSKSIKFGASTSGAEIQSIGSIPLYINYSGNNTLLNTTGGNVGIGTSSPGQLLTLGGASAVQMTLLSNNTGGSSEIYFGSPTSVYRGFIGYFHGTDAMAFHTAASERMRITSGGNVLIGTTTDAGQKLQVNGITQTVGLSLSGTSVSSSTTISSSYYMWVFNGGSGQTLTLYSPSGHNNTHFIKNSSANSLTLSGTYIETLTSTTTVTSYTIPAYKTVQLISNGGSVWIIMNAS